jgi:hypothetical protein
MNEQQMSQKITVAVNMSDSQNDALRKAAIDWDIGISTILRRLVTHVIYRIFTKHDLTLDELLRKYHRLHAASFENSPGKNEKKSNKPSVRLAPKNYQAFDVLAEQGFYRNGELLNILIELFIVGIISKDEIWSTEQ